MRRRRLASACGRAVAIEAHNVALLDPVRDQRVRQPVGDGVEEVVGDCLALVDNGGGFRKLLGLAVEVLEDGAQKRAVHLLLLVGEVSSCKRKGAEWRECV